MTSLSWPDHLLTLEEWDALPEDVSRRFELVEGVLQMSPRPVFAHQVAVSALVGQLNDRLISAGWCAIAEVDVVVRREFPSIVRAPDVVVVPLDFARTRPARCEASDVRVAVEIISPGSARIDRIAKLADYADAGIVDYWILDVDDRAVLDAFRLTDGGYVPIIRGAVGPVAVDAPVELTLDLDALAL